MSDTDNKLKEIINLLKVDKKDKDDSWNKAVANGIGILCNFLSNLRPQNEGIISSENLKTAIRIIATIQYAKEMGVSEAKKRTLNLSFLKNNIPEQSNTYLENELTIYSFLALRNLRENWCASYICDEIRSINSRDIIKPLIQWLENLNISLCDQLILLSKAKPNFYSEEEWVIFILELATKHAKKDLSKFNSHLVEFLITIITSQDSENIKLSALEQINQLSQASSFMLLRSEIANYLSYTRESKSKKSYFIRSQICKRYLDTVTELIKINSNKDLIINLQNLWMIYESLLNKKDAIKMSGILNACITSLDENGLDNLSEGIEYLAADLLCAWQELPESIRMNSSHQELSNKLEILKINLNISQYSSKGEKVIYDPIFQEPISKDFLIENMVSVFKPGYFQTRKNGTTKVIKKALVSN
jgi:hypothetical protein